MSDGELIPAEPRSVREEILRNRAIEITGSADADQALAALYEGFDDEPKRKSAMNMFVVESLTTEEIAKKLEVPRRTVAAWAFVGKWNQAASMEMAVLQEEEAIGLARLRLQKRRQIVEKQLDSAQMIRNKVEDELDNMSAKSAAEALKSVADIEARALGMSESGRTEFTEERESKGSKGSQDSKTSLVVVIPTTASGIPTLRKKDKVTVVDTVDTVVDIEES